MTLRTRTLALIGVTLAALVGLLYGVSRQIVHGGFRQVERDLFEGFGRIEDEDARRNVQRVTDALASQLENLSVKASDWAMWDDTYQFVVDHNRAYVESNLTDEALGVLKINLLVILDGKGNQVFGRAFDLDKGGRAPLPAGLAGHLRPGGRLLAHRDPEGVVAGLLNLPEGPLMVVSRPIVTSEGEGPIRGTFLFGRFVDAALVDQLAKITHLTVKSFRADQPLPAEFAQAASAAGGIRIKAGDEQTISGYTAVRDLAGRPAVALRIDVPRAIYRQGLATQAEIRQRGRVILGSLVASIGLAGLALGAVILWVLESSVLSRLARLSRKAAHIGASGDFTGRVEAEGRDEIATLAGSLNEMLGALAASHDQVEASHAEMALLMATVPTGLLSLDEEFRVNPEHSRSAPRILGTGDLRGRPFPEVLGLTGEREPKGRELVEFLDVLRQELVDEEIVAGLNPCPELALGTGDEVRWVRLRYFLIRRGEGRAPHILVTVEDISEEKRLAEEVARSEQENLQLKAIAENPDLFRDFLVETGQILRHVEGLAARLEGSEDERDAVHEIFRGVHTIKGVAGSFRLGRLSELSGELETSLEPLRRGGAIPADGVARVRERIAGLVQAFEEVVREARGVLGEEFDAEGGMSLRIPLAELRRHMEEIRRMHIDEELKAAMVAKIKEEILRRLRSLEAVPARRGLGRSLKIVPGLIERLGKDVEFAFGGQDTPVDCEVASELNTPLVHLIRNALDHGIEPAEERVESGKPPTGRLELSVATRGDVVELVLEDDGRGLDPERLKAAALRKGVLAPEEAERLSTDEAYALIFRPGFSTADQVTDVSGRGVGMDAVLDAVRAKLGGEIRVESTPGRGTRFVIAVPAWPPQLAA